MYHAPTNSSLCVTPPVHPVIDPFLIPELDKFKKMDNWLRKRGERIKINGYNVFPSWFTSLETPEESLDEQEIDATLSLFALRRHNYEAYFHKHHLPRATFIETWFFNMLSCSYTKFLKPESNRKFVGDCVEVVNGKNRPNKAWGTDVEVIYGLTKDKKSRHWIGMVINVKKHTITRISCGHPTEQDDSVITHVQHFAEMIPVLMCVAANKEVTDKERVPYKVDTLEGKSIPKTNYVENCALFVLKMIECHSMGIKDMSKLTDDTSDDIRSKLACDLFEELGGDIISDFTPVRSFL